MRSKKKGETNPNRHIVKLEAENVKVLKAVTITPDGNTVFIGGKNASGKSTVLDAIMYALCGKRSISEEPIRNGEDQAKIVLDLGELVIRRTFHEGGKTYLTVENKEGARFQSPQKLLDSLIGKISFDPTSFAMMTPAEQSEELRRVLNIDFTILDKKREEIYQERRVCNSRVADHDAHAKQIREGLPDEIPREVDESKLIKKLAKVEEYAELTREAEHYASEIGSLSGNIKDYEDTIEDMKSEREGYKEKLAEITKKMGGYSSQIHNADPGKIRERLQVAIDTNKSVRAFKGRRDDLKLAEKSAAQERAVSESHSREIAQIDQQKRDAIANANFPVTGLSMDPETMAVLYDDILFSEASDAEKILVSTAIAIAANSKLRVILIRQGSLMDEDSLALITDMAEKNDMQVWVEVVGGDHPSSVIIEDGMVAS